MRTAIVLLVAKPRRKREPVNYLIGYHHVLQSLRRHNRDVPEVVVLSPDLEETPAGADRLVRVDTEAYRAIRRTQSAFGQSVFYKLDLFRLDYDRVIYLDTDLLIVDDISELWNPNRYGDHALYGVRESADIGLKHAVWQGKINAGLLLVNRPWLGEEVFQQLLKIAVEGRSYDSGDQGVIHEFLSRPGNQDQVGTLSPGFNLPTCVRVDGDWEQFAPLAKVWHFLGPRKPWMDRPDHRWFHADTQAIWDREVACHEPVPDSLLAIEHIGFKQRMESLMLKALRLPLLPFIKD